MIVSRLPTVREWTRQFCCVRFVLRPTAFHHRCVAYGAPSSQHLGVCGAHPSLHGWRRLGGLPASSNLVTEWRQAGQASVRRVGWYEHGPTCCGGTRELALALPFVSSSPVLASALTSHRASFRHQALFVSAELAQPTPAALCPEETQRACSEAWSSVAKFVARSRIAFSEVAHETDAASYLRPKKVGRKFSAPRCVDCAMKQPSHDTAHPTSRLKKTRSMCTRRQRPP